MTNPDEEALSGQERAFLERLVAYDESIARGETPSPSTYSPDPSDPDNQRWRRTASLVEMLRDCTPVADGAEAVTPRLGARLPSPVSEPLPEQTPAPAAAEELSEVPVKIGRFLVERELGRGGTGAVYLARDPELGRQVAVKLVVKADPETAVRFRSEAEALARLQHPSIVQIFETGSHEGKPFLVMEYVSGGSLKELLLQVLLPPPEAARLTATLARAAQAAHQVGIIHRDLKPANVLLQEETTTNHTNHTNEDRRVGRVFETHQQSGVRPVEDRRVGRVFETHQQSGVRPVEDRRVGQVFETHQQSGVRPVEDRRVGRVFETHQHSGVRPVGLEDSTHPTARPGGSRRLDPPYRFSYSCDSWFHATPQTDRLWPRQAARGPPTGRRKRGQPSARPATCLRNRPAGAIKRSGRRSTCMGWGPCFTSCSRDGRPSSGYSPST